MIKLSRKIAAELVIDGEKTLHVFETTKLDNGLIRMQKELMKAGVVGPDSKMPPEIIENLINVYNNAFVSVEGYECEEDGGVDQLLIPPMHKVSVITGLIPKRLGGPSKNSKPASGE